MAELLRENSLLVLEKRRVKGDYRLLKIKDLPENERPYEKCEKYGAGVLSDAELLAVVIRTGTKHKRSVELALEILKLCGRDGLAGLHDLSNVQLMKVPGIGRVKAVQIRCVLELSKRLFKAQPENGLGFTNPQVIAGYYMETMRHYRQEHLVLVMLNTKNRKIGDVVLSKGSVNAAMISPRDIFLEALRHDAVNIILLHNHPSGDPSPSREDIEVTATIAHLGQMLGIRLLDHIIIGDKAYLSLFESGQMPRL
ncbi:MAG: DNA repair protein RadC [Clostridiales bacterium]|nr:DNA repair protein RadC [Clostridiales bacterium]